MTVGIAFTNGLEAIVVTDSRVGSSIGGLSRQSDSVNKLELFNRDTYSGAIFGSGNGNLIEGVLRNLIDFNAPDLDTFAQTIHQGYKRKVDQNSSDYLTSQVKEIEKKSDLISDAEEKKQFVRQKTHELMQEYDMYTQRNPTDFIIVGFDKDKAKIKAYNINVNTAIELNMAHIEIGMGSDGAGLYLSTKLPGIDTTKLSLTDLAFFGLNAYSTSTTNQGVGGTPKIAKISKDGSEMLPMEKTVTLTNISGAYLSEFSNSILGNNSAREKFKEVLSTPAPDYAMIAKEIGLNEEALRTTYIPYSSWQERSNRKTFSK